MRTKAKRVCAQVHERGSFVKLAFATAFCLGLSLSPDHASAQSNPRFVSLGGGAVGAVYTPDSGPAPHVAFISVHRTGNNMTAVPTTELSKRGFMVLGIATRFVNNEASVNWEDI